METGVGGPPILSQGKPQQDLTRYFCMHPGGTRDLAHWMHDTQISWWGIDAGSGDHPMNTTIRYMRTDLIHRFEEKVGKSDFHPHGSRGPA